MAPLDIRPAEAATHGPSTSGKYALRLLQLEDVTSPLDPIGAQVLNDLPANGAPFGTGLMQIPVNNATTEPVYVTIDLTKPAATWSTQAILNKTSIDAEAGNADCGPSRDVDGDPLPADTTRPWCIFGGLPAASAGTATPLASGAVTSTYGVRVWEELPNGSFNEITTNCPGCNQVPPNQSTVRLTVLLPARAGLDILGRPSPQRKFWLMPVIGTVPQLRPGDVGPFTEFPAAGTQLTGAVIAPIVRRCSLPLENVGGSWRCSAPRTARTYNAVRSAQVNFTLPAVTNLYTSFDGASATAPFVTRQHQTGLWTTNEPALQ